MQRLPPSVQRHAGACRGSARGVLHGRLAPLPAPYSRCAELFETKGLVAGALQEDGWAAGQWDVRFGDAYDLSDKKGQTRLLGWVRSGLVREWGAAPPASCWVGTEGEASDSRSRGSRETARLISSLRRLSVAMEISWVIHLPFSSRKWLVPSIRRLMKALGVQTADTECGNGGGAHRRRTRLVGFAVQLGNIENRCNRSGPRRKLMHLHRHRLLQNLVQALAAAFVDDVARARAPTRSRI